MSSLISYLERLGKQNDELSRAVARLGPLMARRIWCEQLTDLSERDPRWHAVTVPGEHLGLRIVRKWAVIGDGGIPDDVRVVSEGVSLLRPFSEVVQPDLEGFRRSGFTVLSKEEFLALIANLREEVLAGRLTLPFHP